MKIATVTPIWNNEQFLHPHFKMISELENIVILGEKPFPEYADVYKVSSVPDKSEDILRTEFPKVRILKATTNEFGADLLNPGVELAEQLGYDLILKLDADMLLDKTNWRRLIDFLSDDLPFDVFRLNYRDNTMVYYKDFEHGAPCRIAGPGAGSDIVALSTKNRFIGNLHSDALCENTINWSDFIVHHFVGFKPSFDVESFAKLRGITEWTKCPQEVIDMFT